MLIFSITTSTKYMSMSLFENNEYISNISIKANKTHSRNLYEQFSKFLEWNGKSILDIDKLIISKGPGSFTGIRVAMALIKGAFIDTKAKIYEIDEFQGYEYRAKKYDYDLLITIIDGQKEKVYTKIKDEYRVMQLDDLLQYIYSHYRNSKICIVGDAMIRHSEKIEKYFKDNNIVQVKTDIDINYINTNAYIEMCNNNLLKEVSLSKLKPEYFEKIETGK